MRFLRSTTKGLKLSLAIGSAFIAFVIWLFVFNVSNPEVTDTVTAEIRVDYGDYLTNLNKYYVLDTSSARISYKVRQGNRYRVSASDFEAYVDLRDFSVTGALPVYFTVKDPSRKIISDAKVTPLVIHITTENMKEKKFDITPNIIGTPADGYTAAGTNFSPDGITVYAPASEIGKIARVEFDVNVDNASMDISGTVDPIFYDSDNNIIRPGDSMTIRNSVNFTTSIYKVKNISIITRTQGTPAPGYELATVESEPKFLEVYGEEPVLNNVNAIILPGALLDINGAKGDITASINISDYLVEGIGTHRVENIALVARINKRSTPLSPPPTSPSAADQTGSPLGSDVIIHPTAAPADQPAADNASASQTVGSDSHIMEKETLPGDDVSEKTDRGSDDAEADISDADADPDSDGGTDTDGDADTDVNADTGSGEKAGESAEPVSSGKNSSGKDNGHNTGSDSVSGTGGSVS